MQIRYGSLVVCSKIGRTLLILTERIFVEVIFDLKRSGVILLYRKIKSFFRILT